MPKSGVGRSPAPDERNTMNETDKQMIGFGGKTHTVARYALISRAKVPGMRTTDTRTLREIIIGRAG